MLWNWMSMTRSLFSWGYNEEDDKEAVQLLTLTNTGRYSVKEKVTLANLFYLHSMDGGELVDVPWHVVKFLCDKAKGVITRGQETQLLDLAKLGELGMAQ
ncbi:hypothetical protein Tco_0715195 [Tanacetum coccineum]